MFTTYNPNAINPPDEEQCPYECPVCGTPLNEDETVFVSTSGEVIGCEFCISERPAGEVWQ